MKKGIILNNELTRLRELEELVQSILNQSNDEHCWMDWGIIYPKLAHLVNMPEWKPRILPKNLMLKNCEHFINCLASGVHYEAPIITELKKIIETKQLDTVQHHLKLLIKSLTQS